MSTPAVAATEGLGSPIVIDEAIDARGPEQWVSCVQSHKTAFRSQSNTSPGLLLSLGSHNGQGSLSVNTITLAAIHYPIVGAGNHLSQYHSWTPSFVEMTMPLVPRDLSALTGHMERKRRKTWKSGYSLHSVLGNSMLRCPAITNMNLTEKKNTWMLDQIRREKTKYESLSISSTHQAWSAMSARNRTVGRRSRQIADYVKLHDFLIFRSSCKDYWVSQCLQDH